MTTPFWRRVTAPTCLRMPLLALLSLISTSLCSAEPKKFSLAAGDAALTLRQFSAQSGEQLVFPVEQVRGLTTKAVEGDFESRQALDRMLDGTGLVVTQDERTGALAVNRATAPAAATGLGSPASGDETIVLSPFEVKAETDTGYGALQSNSLTAFRVDLDKMPATVQVFTATFMDDIAAGSIQDMLANYTGTVGASPDNAGAVINNMPGDRDGSGGGVGIRGLAAGPPKRDGMSGMRTSFRSALGYSDPFSIERVELISGPQSLLYGAVGGGGVINMVSKRAQFGQNRGFVQTRFDQYGSKRGLLDYNLAVNNFAARVAVVGEDRRNVRFRLGNEFNGFYAQMAYRILPRTTARIFFERQNNWANVAYNPSSADINAFLPVGDPRRGQDVRYLALTGQLENLQGSIWNGPVDYFHISSFGSWWSSEKINGDYSGITVESALPANFSLQMTGIYSETEDLRVTVGKNLLPANTGGNPFSTTAVRVSPGDNIQSDRTRGFRTNLLHEGRFTLFGINARAQTAGGFEYSHQGPAFGSSGMDRLYYQADENWNPIISPTITSDYGRIPLANIYFPVGNGIPKSPVFQPGSERIVVDGQRYVLQRRIRQDQSRVSPTNPFGLVPNNPTTANPNQFAGNWNRGGETHARLFNLANYTEWADAKLTTIMGASLNRFETLNAGPTSVTFLPPRNYWGYQVGANYAVRDWLRVWATFSTSAQAAGTTKDYYGNPLKVPKAESPVPELGVKVNSRDGRYSAQLSHNFSTAVENETRNAGADFFNAVNPDGINGRFNSGDQWINLDRKSSSTELIVTARPVRNWRMRLAAVHLDGEITNTVKFAQLYNDEFNVNGSGVVTYANGTPILVDPTGGTGARTSQLTLAMINNPSNPYWAAPDANSGRITSGALRRELMRVDPTNGTAATGRTGLPYSLIQYNFGNPLGGEVTVVSEGDKNTGINEYTLNFQSNYTFSAGPLRGFGVFTGVRTYFKNRAYYTTVFPAGSTNTVQAERSLYRLPTSTVVDLNFSYRFKLPQRLNRFTFTTQLNINNVFDNSKVWVLPSNTNAANLNARLSESPRQFILSNTLAF